MANRRQPFNNRRSDFGRNDRPKVFTRPGVSPWQGAAPTAGIASLLPLAQGSTEATLALANNLINNLLQTRQNTVPSLLDMPIRRDFAPEPMRFDRGGSGYNNNQRMGNQGNFRRQWNNNRSGDRNNSNQGSFRPRDGPRQQYRNYPKKDADSKPKPSKKSDEKKDETVVKAEPSDQNEEETEEKTDKSKKDDTKKDDTKKDETKKEAPKTRYDDINPSLLRCHICNTSMWDGRSFENHINGLAHSIMMQKTAESYALTADTIRQEIKIREMKRTRKSRNQPTHRDFYCAMCDMYASDGVAHRTTLGHRKLKKYLHPACSACRKELPTRIELDEHRLTAEHLKRMHPQDLDKAEAMMVYNMSQELLNVRGDTGRRRRNYSDKDGDDSDQPRENIKIEANDSEGTVLDYKEGDDVSAITKELLPSYSTERGLGRSFLAEYRCVQCKLCKKLLDSDETAEVHLKTKRHYLLFVKLLKEKSGCMGENQTGSGANKSSGKSNQVANKVKRAANAEDEEIDENTDRKRRRTLYGVNDEIKLEDDDVEMGDGHRSPEEQDAASAALDQSWELPADEEVENWDEPATNGATDLETKNGDVEEQKSTKVEEPAENEKNKEEDVAKPKVEEKAPPVKVSPVKRNSNRGSPRGRGNGNTRKN